jgi:hypothetical protein
MERKAGLAVLIDADNVQAAALPVVLDDIFKRRTVAVRRVYGDFSNPCLHPRLACIQAHAFHPVQVFPGAPGKNASDIALVIDAMDLLHTRALDGLLSLLP